MLLNILHCERPEILLHEARRVLGAGGMLGIMHWNFDSTTAGGPSMSIRPRPAQCEQWAEQAGFETQRPGIIELPPYHYGIVFRSRAPRS
jgi:hypothetical protein